MDTTMAQAKRSHYYRKCCLCPLLAVLPFSLLSAAAHAAETRFEPTLRSALYAYQIEPELSTSKDEGAAWELSPALAWYRSAANMQTRFNWQHDSLLYKDEQRERSHYNELTFSNELTALNRRLSWEVNAQQNYQIRDSRRGIFSDKITGAENLSKVLSYGSAVRYRNIPTAKYRTEVALRFTEFDSDATLADDGFGSYETTSYSMNWAFGTSARAMNFFWLYDGVAQEIERSSDSDVSIRTHNLTLGVPFAPNISVVGRLGSERVDNQSNYNNKFDYFGGGLEYRFGARSRINLTVNKSDSGVAGENSETDTYVATEFVFAPTRRTSFEGSLDRRYFGRSLVLQGKYNLRFLSIRANVSDRVLTQNLFDFEMQDLGVFVCPNNSSSFADCFRPPTNQYVPAPDENLQQLNIVSAELRQEVVKIRNTGINVGYAKNRLNLNVNLNIVTTDYVERGDESENRNIGLQASWQLNDHNKLFSNISYYDIDYSNDNRKDNNLSAAIGYQRTLTAKSEAKVTVRRLNRNSSLADFDNSENRIWLDYQYRF